MASTPQHPQQNPKISIITVVFNGADVLEDTIQSILSQTYQNIEYIVIDGGSTDGTVEIIKKHQDKIHYWISEPDGGIYDAMNKGVDKATGEIVGLLNSDDFYANNQVIEKVATTFTQQNIDSTYGDLDIVNPDNVNKVIRRWRSKPYTPDLFKKGWHPAHPTFFVKKFVYEKYGVFDTEYKIAADYDLMLRFLERHHISTKYVPEVWIKMRQGGMSNKSIWSILCANYECHRAWKKNGLKIGFYVALLKPLSKISQLFSKN